MPGTTTRRRATPQDASARILLDRLGEAIDGELQQRRVAAELEPADRAPIDIAHLSSIIGDLPSLGIHTARALRSMAAVTPSALTRGLRSLAATADRHAALRRREANGESTTDDFGFSEEWTQTLVDVLMWAYKHWWRVQVRGIENVPKDGRALLVSNHAGVLPWDGAMIRLAILDKHPKPRHARALVLDGLVGAPFASWFVRRSGNTLANNADADALLNRDELVLVFPEGARGTGKLYSERYRLRRFGRGGFAELAMRTGSPIIPVSVVGSEEIHPMLADFTALARLLGAPYMPLTPALLPLPSTWIIEFHPPVEPTGEAADPASVMRIADSVRDTIQAGVYSNLERRGSVFAVS